jgi:hypothetical protein
MPARSVYFLNATTFLDIELLKDQQMRGAQRLSQCRCRSAQIKCAKSCGHFECAKIWTLPRYSLGDRGVRPTSVRQRVEKARSYGLTR